MSVQDTEIIFVRLEHEVGRVDLQKMHSFVVKMWLEVREIRGAKPIWRGRIDHVQSGKRIYFYDKAKIIPFIESFLEKSSKDEHQDDLPADEQLEQGSQ